MLTHTGTWITDANDAVPSPLDIAVASGRITRFAGALWMPLIAHITLVSWISLRRGQKDDYRTWYAALLHDAHEVVLGEVPSSAKTASRKKQERTHDRRIFSAYNCQKGIDKDVIEVADKVALFLEGRRLKLPGFARLSDGFPHPTMEEREFFDRLLTSDWMEPAVTTDPESGPVQQITAILNIRGDAKRLPDARRYFEKNVVPQLRGPTRSAISSVSRLHTPAKVDWDGVASQEEMR